MTTLEQKKAERIAKNRKRKQQETEEFLNRVDIIQKFGNDIVGILKETEKCYLDYQVARYPKCLLYKLSMKKKVHPFDIYYSKEFFKDNIPKKYQKVFEELEKYFK